MAPVQRHARVAGWDLSEWEGIGRVGVVREQYEERLVERSCMQAGQLLNTVHCMSVFFFLFQHLSWTEKNKSGGACPCRMCG